MLKEIQALLRKAYLNGYRCDHIASYIDEEDDSIELKGLYLEGCHYDTMYHISLNDVIMGLPNENTSFLEALGYNFEEVSTIRCRWASTNPSNRIEELLKMLK